MLNTCHACGLYRPDKVIDLLGPYAVCPECGHRHSFLQLPLLMVAGASGTGKSTVGRKLAGTIRNAVVMEADILWRPEFNRPEDKYRDFFETWLRVCKNISQSGRPVVLLCSGGIPENIERCVERRYFAEVHYLALTSESEDLTERLKQRPAWRESGDEETIRAQVAYNDWFRQTVDQTTPPIELLNTTGMAVEETVAQVAAWIDARHKGRS